MGDREACRVAGSGEPTYATAEIDFARDWDCQIEFKEFVVKAA
jgi:hypothetical protein